MRTSGRSARNSTRAINWSQFKNYNIDSLQSFPATFFENTPAKYRNNNKYMYVREPMTHAAAIIDRKTGKVVKFIDKKEYWDQIKK